MGDDNQLMKLRDKSLVRLPEPQFSQVSACLQRGDQVSLSAQIEVMELGERSRALIWIRGPRGGAARMASCSLNPAQWAESMLCLKQGLRPVYEVNWRVLTQLSDGRFALIVEEPPMQPYPPYLSESLNDLIGNEKDL